MIDRHALFGCLLAPMALLSLPAQAQYVEYQIQGTVLTVFDTPDSAFKPIYDQFGFQPVLGDTVTVTYRVNGRTAGTVSVPSDIEYPGALSWVTVTVTHGQRTGKLVISPPQPADNYITILNNSYGGGIYESGYYLAVGPANDPSTGDTAGFLFYAVAATQTPLSPPLYPNAALCQSPPPASTPSLGTDLEINLEHWEGGFLVAQNYLFASYVSADMTPASC